MGRYRNNKCNCTYAGGQFIILSSIFAAILVQEIENLEDLELLAAFLVALADELALAIVARSQCENKYNGDTGPIVEVVLDKEQYAKKKAQQKPSRKVVKRVVKKVKPKK